MKNSVENKRTIVTGNFFSQHSPIISVGSDYRITEPDGTAYFYRYRFENGENKISVLEPIEIIPGSEIEWGEMNIPIREEHFKHVFPDGVDEETKILFIYGEEEGNRILDKMWAESHTVKTKEITIKLIEKIGRFKTFRRLRTTLLSNTSRLDVYLLDEKFQVTIYTSGNNISYTIEDYSSAVASRKEFEKRTKSLFSKANVPYEIAYLVGHIEGEKRALEILNKIKSSRSFVTESRKKDLLSGNIYRMNQSLRTILGDKTFSDLNLKSRKKIVTLSSYLAKVTN